jgi:hypothetical protein
MIGDVPVGILEVDAIRVERGAQRAARVAGRRRHEQALETGFGEEPCVGHAIERHATAEAQVGQAGFAPQRPRDVQQRVLEHRLHAGRAVGEPAAVVALQIDRIVGVAGAPKSSTNAGENDRLALVWYSKYSGTSANPPSAVRRITFRRRRTSSDARRRPAHHLVLAVVHREAEVRRERRIEHPERMGKPDLASE